MSLQVEHIVAFNRLYEEYSQRFIRFAKGYVMTDEAAEDIVNDSFMYYWENRQAIVDDNIAAYLLTTVKHKCINYLKHLALEAQAISHFQALEEWELQLKISTLEACNPELLLSDEVQVLVRQALAAMPRKTREVLIKSRYNALSNKEIADELAISVKAVEYHMTKALKALRVALKDYFPVWIHCFPGPFL